jgi:hypothetical protein
VKVLVKLKVQLIGALPGPCEFPLVDPGWVKDCTTVPELSVMVPVKVPNETGTSTEVLFRSCAGEKVLAFELPLLTTALYVWPLSQLSDIGCAVLAFAGSAEALPAMIGNAMIGNAMLSAAHAPSSLLFMIFMAPSLLDRGCVGLLEPISNRLQAGRTRSGMEHFAPHHV